MSKLRLKSSDRRIISFENDIVDDVYKKLDGKYSRDIIKRVYRAQISYAIDLLTFSDVSEVYLPFVGILKLNADRMRIRINSLKRRKKKRGCLPDDLKKELSMLEMKVEEINEMRKEGKLKGNDLHAINFTYYLRHLEDGIGFDNLQNFQEDKFNNT